MFAIKSCLDLDIFNEKGEKVIDINICNDAEIIFYNKYDEDRDITKKKCLLALQHEMNSFDLLELKNGTYENKSDFDKAIGDIEISFGENINDKTYKMIGTFLIRMEDGTDKKVRIIFNNAAFANICDYRKDVIEFSCDKVSSFNTIFDIKLDKDGNFFTMKSNK